jgi:hypothetical protein
MYVFRINQLKIHNNREWGQAEVVVTSFVTTNDAANLPNLSELSAVTDPAARRALVAQAANQVISSRELTRVDHVKDGHKFTFGDTGFSLHSSATIPDELHWALLVWEDDSDVRDVGTFIESVLGDDDFDELSGKLLNTLAAGATPAKLYFDVAKFVTGRVARALKQNKDDQVGVLYQSWNRPEHYPHGIRNREDVSDLSGNMKIDYSMFGME